MFTAAPLLSPIETFFSQPLGMTIVVLQYQEPSWNCLVAWLALALVQAFSKDPLPGWNLLVAWLALALVRAFSQDPLPGWNLLVAWLAWLLVLAFSQYH
jgi:hypothetical protein